MIYLIKGPIGIPLAYLAKGPQAYPVLSVALREKLDMIYLVKGSIGPNSSLPGQGPSGLSSPQCRALREKLDMIYLVKGSIGLPLAYLVKGPQAYPVLSVELRLVERKQLRGILWAVPAKPFRL
jgi:hypothetical protein